MLNSIRVFSANWLGRSILTVVMGFLIFSFAVWGIGDIFRGSTSRNVAEIGGARISLEDFRNNFDLELRRLQQKARRLITIDEAKTYGLDRIILGRMIDETALEQEAQALGMAVGNEDVVRSLTIIPDFMTAGQFDREKFSGFLQQAGLSEGAFFEQQKNSLLRLQLIKGLIGEPVISPISIRAINFLSQ